MRKKLIMVVLVIGICLNGCNKKETENNSPAVETSAKWEEDFLITLSSDHEVYKEKDLYEEEPLNFVLTVEYLGEEQEIEVWHGIEIGYITVKSKEGETAFSPTRESLEKSSYLEANKPISVTWNAIEMTEKYLSLKKDKESTWSEFFLNFGYIAKERYEFLHFFEKGDYIVEAEVSFSLDEEYTKRVECTLELPFSVCE